MATGDQADFTSRLLRLLPTGWFPSAAPRLNAALQGAASAFSAGFGILSVTKAQTRIQTAGGSFLDLISEGYFGGYLPRLEFEEDAEFRARIIYNLTAPRGTFTGMYNMLLQLTGNAPIIWQPNMPEDCGGGWGTLQAPDALNGSFFWVDGIITFGGGPTPNIVFSFGDNPGGTWGTMLMPCQVFINVQPPETGYSVFGELAGYSSQASDAAGGPGGYSSLADITVGGGETSWSDPSSVPGLITDSMVFQQVSAWMPAGYQAWLSISETI